MVQNLVKKSGRIMLLCSLSLLLVLTTSCNETKLKAVVEIANKQCPMDMGEAGKITSIVYDGENVVYNFQVSDQIADINVLKNNPESMKLYMKTMFQNPTPEVKEMLKLMVECNAGLQMVFIGRDSNNQATCELTAAELKELLNTKTDAADSDLAKLEAQLNIANLQFPMKASDEITIEKIELSDESVIYICKVDESKSDVNRIKENAENVKQSVLSTLASQTDAATQIFIKSCVNSNRSISYRYIGDTSGTQYDIVITIPELQAMLIK